MEAKEILEKKEFLKIEDIKVIFQCKKSCAYKRLAEIKSVSDALGLPGMVHKTDYYKFIETRRDAYEDERSKTGKKC